MIVSIMVLSSPTFSSTSLFVILSVHLIFSILLQYHTSNHTFSASTSPTHIERYFRRSISVISFSALSPVSLSVSSASS
uniref:Putative secreted protein n=1 Tax=Xenopsylla cheopis TaxID=163159 RepID=A0A6M2DXB0_XENCH